MKRFSYGEYAILLDDWGNEIEEVMIEEIWADSYVVRYANSEDMAIVPSARLKEC